MAATAVMAPSMGLGMGMGMMGYPRAHRSPPRSYMAPPMARQAPAPSLVSATLHIGSVVCITTTLAGLKLKGILLGVDRVTTDLTIQTARFGKPLRVEAWNIRDVETVSFPGARRTAAAGAKLSPVDELALLARQAPASPPRSPRSSSPGSRGSPSQLNHNAATFVPSSLAGAAPAGQHRLHMAQAPPMVALPPSAVHTHMHHRVAAAAPPPGFGSAGLYAPAPAMAAPVPRMQRSPPMAGPLASPARSMSASPDSVASAGSGSSDSAGSQASSKSKWDTPCKYFNTAKGCTRGSACRYRHVKMDPAEVAALVGEEASAAAVPRVPSFTRGSSTGKARKTRRGRKRGGRM